MVKRATIEELNTGLDLKSNIDHNHDDVYWRKDTSKMTYKKYDKVINNGESGSLFLHDYYTITPCIVLISLSQVNSGNNIRLEILYNDMHGYQTLYNSQPSNVSVTSHQLFIDWTVIKNGVSVKWNITDGNSYRLNMLFI